MFKKHLLYLSDEHLQATIWYGGQARATTTFATNDTGVAEFTEYLKRWAKLRTYLLVDLIEEDFRLDAIPHVGNRDRNALLGRKLAQVYRATPYRYAKVQGRDKTGRRDDHVLYTAITNPDLLTDWLAAIEAQQVPLVGIYSAPLLSRRLLKPLNITAKHVLLVTLHDGDHLRQNYSQDGEIKFSRMTPLNTRIPEQLSARVSEEVRKTWQYLEGLRHLVTGEPLHVCIVARPNDIRSADFEATQISGIDFQFFDLAQVAKNLGVKIPVENSNSESLLLHLLGRAPWKNHFAQPQQTRHALIWRAKQLTVAAGAAALLVSTALGSVNLLEGKLLAANVKQAQNDTARIETEQQAVRSHLPVTNIAPDAMSNTVSFYTQNIHAAPSYRQFLIQLSRVLDRFPNIRLEELSWGISNDPNKLPFPAPSFPSSGATQTAVSDDAKLNPAGSLPVLAGQYYQVAIVSASITPFNQGYRLALEELQRVALVIEQDMHGKVIPLMQPLDTSVRVGMQGKATPTQEQGDARFALKLVIPPVKR